MVLHRLVKTDRDVHLRQRAQALLLVAEGQSTAAVAWRLHIGPNRIRAWRTRFLTEWGDGLVDRPRRGRPPKLDATPRDFLREALDAGPQAPGLPMTGWSSRDLQALLLCERGVAVSAYTVQCTLLALGYRYRRSRRALTHRQDHEAVLPVRQVLA